MHKELVHSTALWMTTFLVGGILFIIFVLPHALHYLGLLLGAMGGNGLEGSGL